MAFAAGDLTRPGKHNVDTLPVGATENISKGNFVRTDGSGNGDKMAAETNLNGVFVALEAGDNSSGSDGSIEIQVAGPGSEVCVLAGGAIEPGAPIKVNSDSEAIAAVAGDVESDLVVGTYLKHPGEDKATPAADTEVIVVRIRGSV